MSAGSKESEDFVESESGWSLSREEVESVVEVTNAVVEKPEDKPKMGPVYGRGDRGQLVIVEESDEN